MLLSPKFLVCSTLLLFAQNIILEDAFAGSRRSRKKNRRVTYETYEYSEPTSSRSVGSDSLRVAKPFGLGVHAGAMNGMLIGMGPEAHYTINSLLQVEGRFMMGFLDIDTAIGSPASEFIKVDEEEGEAMEFGGRLKIFPLDSFYIAPGLSYRQLTYTINANKDNATMKSEADGSAIALDIGIGNTWTFDSGFYLGCEWLSLSQALSSDFEVTKEATGENPLLGKYQEDFKTYAEDRFDSTNFGLLMMHLGFSF